MAEFAHYRAAVKISQAYPHTKHESALKPKVRLNV